MSEYRVEVKNLAKMVDEENLNGTALLQELKQSLRKAE